MARGVARQCRGCEVEYLGSKTHRSPSLCLDCYQTHGMCGSCKVVKLKSEFCAATRKANGIQSWCKSCSQRGSECSRCGDNFRRHEGRGQRKLCPTCATDFAWCFSCKDSRSIAEFDKNSSTASGLSNRCRTCKRNEHLKRTYGLDAHEYYEMLEEQGGVCAICRCPPDSEFLYVDHDHRTDKVRGLLCHGCNSGIGYLKDDLAVILRAADYVLERTPAMVLPQGISRMDGAYSPTQF